MLPYLFAVQTPALSLYCDVSTPRDVEACALNFLDITGVLVRSDDFSYLCRSNLSYVNHGRGLGRWLQKSVAVKMLPKCD